MVCFPNGKINIGLYITSKRTDGYHNLETIFYPLAKPNDVLEIVPAEAVAMHLYGKAVAGDVYDNLVWKAYMLLQKDFPAIPPFSVHLLKNIPMGAGMGGGSADGAFMLRLLNDYCSLGLDNKQLIGYALQLGSDCPFFIENTPQYATGRGEVMQPIAIDLSAYSIQLICPQVHVSTAAAFKMITPKPAPFDLRQLQTIPIAQWKDLVNNDFEAPVFAQHPQLAAIKQQLYDAGAIYAAMSGSGSTVYGVFEKGCKASIATTLPYEEHYCK
ncbi:4-(cytidine 5'-diphospho)-2-C-methyl-D-erythritol kinase [Chitinophagaceae bacterium IBVUCB1]|nr:4-(cytidine 5'-diphospho)-2-C-methyl-D-erythritol kinase [Chitinophagaceae bacterium IBVUCB1]